MGGRERGKGGRGEGERGKGEGERVEGEGGRGRERGGEGEERCGKGGVWGGEERTYKKKGKWGERKEKREITLYDYILWFK